MDQLKLSLLEDELNLPLIRNNDFGSGLLRRGLQNSDTPTLDRWRQGAEPANSRESKGRFHEKKLLFFYFVQMRGGDLPKFFVTFS